MIPRWPRVTVALVGLLIGAVGAAGLLARNWLWGDAGYSVEARQPIMLLGLTFVALGATAVDAARRGSGQRLRLVAGLLVAIVVPVPVVMALNIAGWDRFNAATGWPLPLATTAFSALVGLPTLLAYLVLRRAEA